MEISNKKAHFDYQIEETIECGIVLTGTEIKSIREGSCNIGDSYGHIRKGELFIPDMEVNDYEENSMRINAYIDDDVCIFCYMSRCR